MTGAVAPGKAKALLQKSNSEPEPYRRTNSSAVVEWLIVIPFLAFFFVQLAHHELWRDELNVWGLALASPTLSSLYDHVRYEGHPGLWYLLLWLVTKVSTSLTALKVLEAVIGAAIYIYIAFRSPFSRWEKLLLYSSYYISFEYTVLTRMYGLCLLLLLVYVHRRSKYPEQVGRNLLLLALLANTDIIGATLSGGFLLEYSITVWQQLQNGAIKKADVWRAAAIYCSGLVLMVVAIHVSPHISWRTTGRMFKFAFSKHHLLQAAVSYITVPWMPIETGSYPQHYWNRWLDYPERHRLVLLGTPLIVAAYIGVFRKEKRLLMLLGVVFISGILFAHLVYMGASRHYGLTFMAFLGALAMQRYEKPQRSVVVIILLLMSAGAGVAAAIGQWHHPFSQGQNLAQWLRDNKLDKSVIIGTPDTSLAEIGERLNRAVYFLDCNCSDTYMMFADRRDDFETEQIPERVAIASKSLHAREMTLITALVLKPDHRNAIERLGFKVDQLAAFTGAEEPEENFFVYRVEQQVNR